MLFFTPQAGEQLEGDSIGYYSGCNPALQTTYT